MAGIGRSCNVKIEDDENNVRTVFLLFPVVYEFAAVIWNRQRIILKQNFWLRSDQWSFFQVGDYPAGTGGLHSCAVILLE